MGMYDMVMLKCPSCGASHEAQSKSGPCLLDEFTLENAPDDVLQDVNRHAPFLCACGFRLKVDTVLRRCFDTRPYDRRAELVMRRFERNLTEEEQAELAALDAKIEAEEDASAAPGLAKLEALAQKYEDLAEAMKIAVEITQQNAELRRRLDAVTAERDALLAKKPRETKRPVLDTSDARAQVPGDRYLRYPVKTDVEQLVLRSALLRANGISDTGQSDEELMPLARVFPRTPSAPQGSKGHSCPSCGVHHNDCPECGTTMGDIHSDTCPWHGVALRTTHKETILGTRRR